MFLDNIINKLKKSDGKNKTKTGKVNKSGKSEDTDTITLTKVDDMPDNIVDFTEIGDMSDDEFAAVKAKLEEMNNSSEMMRAMSSTIASSGDIDKDIELLLKKQEDIPMLTPFEGTDSNSFINDVSVYNIKVDPDIVDGLKTLKLSKDDNSDKSPAVVFVTAGVLVFLIVATLVFGIYIINRLKAAVPKPKVGVKNVEQPLNMPNNASYIYISDTVMFNSEPLELKKMLIDPLTTVFYFNRYIDVSSCNITLTDSRGRMFGLDLPYAHYNQNFDETKPTVLRFEPLNSLVRSFTLLIEDWRTGESATFEYKLNSMLTMPRTVYINNTEYSGDQENGIYIDNGVFSSSGSQINYVLNWSSQAYRLALDGDSNKHIKMSEGAKSVLSADFYNPQYLFKDDNIVLGRMDFEPVSNLNGKVTLSIDNLYKVYDLNMEINAAGLFADKEENSINIELDEYGVVLERMGFMGDYAVLVLHGAELDGLTDNIEVKLDVELIANTASGMQVIIDGQCTSGPIGTDILFDMSKSRSLINDALVSNYMLNIKSVWLKQDNVDIKLDLSMLPQRMSYERQNTRDFLKRAFENRLAYKSGEIPEERIEGFSQELMENSALMKNYQTEVSEEEKTYSAQIMAYTIIDSKDGLHHIYAVVQETWKGKGHYYATHKIKAENDGARWVITEDQIIK